MNPLPNFILIGPGKCGTSWIYDFLDNHSQVCVSSAKETLYFEDYFSRGLEWYQKFFTPSSAHRAIGEFSNTYIFSEIAAKRIYEFNPDMKLIVTLRNPIKRVFSHYLFLKRNGSVTASFDDILLSDNFLLLKQDLMIRSQYSTHINKYLKYFKAENILYLVLEDLKADPEKYGTKICNFLGLDQDFSRTYVPKKVLPASSPRNIYLARMAKFSAAKVRKMGFPDVLTKVKRSRLVSQFLYKEYSQTNYPVMSDRAQALLLSEYKTDVQVLSDLLSRDLTSLWHLT